MPIIQTPLIEEDEVPTAAELNKPYDDLATNSAIIDADNVASGALTKRQVFGRNSDITFFEDAGSTNITDITSTSYTTLDRGGVDTEIVFPGSRACRNHTPIRISGTGLVTNNTVALSWDDNDPAINGKPNLYAFRILISYNIGGGATQTVSAGEWGYSFGSMSSTDKRATLGTGIAGNRQIHYQTFQFETIYNVSVNNFNLEKIELQAAVYHNGNVLRISRNSLHCIIGDF
jgi:hypothetical protein